GSILQSELSPIEDRSWLRLTVTAPEGAAFDYTDRFMDKISDFVEDSVKEKDFCLTVTAPGFAGSGSVNSGFVRLGLVDPDKRHRSQQELANYVTKMTKQFPEAKTLVIQQQSISSGGFVGGL